MSPTHSDNPPEPTDNLPEQTVQTSQFRPNFNPDNADNTDNAGRPVQMIVRTHVNPHFIFDYLSQLYNFTIQIMQ